MPVPEHLFNIRARNFEREERRPVTVTPKTVSTPPVNNNQGHDCGNTTDPVPGGPSLQKPQTVSVNDTNCLRSGYRKMLAPDPAEGFRNRDRGCAVPHTHQRKLLGCHDVRCQVQQRIEAFPRPLGIDQDGEPTSRGLGTEKKSASVSSSKRVLSRLVPIQPVRME